MLPRSRQAPIESRVFDRGLVALLALAVLLPGILAAFELPGGLEVLADLVAVGLLCSSMAVAIRSGRPIVLPFLALLYLAVLLGAAAVADDLPRLVVAAKNFLLLPGLALALAMLGESEDRNRSAVLAVIGLVGIQFLVTIIQSLTLEDFDLVVGTFGDYSGPSTAFALQAGAVLALAAYFRSGAVGWLALTLLLPLASVWGVIRLVPLVFPLACLAVAVAAAWARGGGAGAPVRRSRVAGVAGGALVASVALWVTFAVAKPFDFGLFTDQGARATYFETADTSAPAREPAAETGGSNGPKTRPAGGSKAQETAPAPASKAPEPVPGRGAQYRIARELVSESPATFVLGVGLGATSYAENIGVEMPANKDLEVAGYSDAGTLLVETGWLGVIVATVIASALGLSSIAAARRARSGSWTQALLVAYPGIIVAMAAGVFHGAVFRNIGSATIFWVLTGLVLSVVINRRSPPQGHSS